MGGVDAGLVAGVERKSVVAGRCSRLAGGIGYAGHLLTSGRAISTDSCFTAQALIHSIKASEPLIKAGRGVFIDRLLQCCCHSQPDTVEGHGRALGVGIAPLGVLVGRAFRVELFLQPVVEQEAADTHRLHGESEERQGEQGLPYAGHLVPQREGPPAEASDPRYRVKTRKSKRHDE